MNKQSRLALILTGTGTCATKAYATYLSSAGYACDHEGIFSVAGYGRAITRLWESGCKHADSSWFAAPYVDDPLLSGALIVHLVRDPRRFIECGMHLTAIRGTGHGKCFLYAAKHCQQMSELGRTWTGYAHRWTCWNGMIEGKVLDVGREYLRFDVAGDPLELLDELKGRSFPLTIDREAQVYKRRDINAHGARGDRKNFCYADSKIKDARILTDMKQLAERYGYIW